MKVVVTGSAGYIGSVLCSWIKHNYKSSSILAIDKKRNNHSYFDFECVADISDKGACKQITKWKPDVIFHLAAEADVSNSTINPALYYDNNTGATARFLNNIISDGYNNPVIFSSTAAVYGQLNHPCQEYEEFSPINSYGASKLCCEVLLRDVNEANKISVACFRYFNVAGSYKDTGDHLDSGHVLQKLCSSWINKKEFTIFGKDYNTKDGTCVRDYIHVVDVCRAHLHVYEYLLKKPGYYTFNLGTGKGVTVKEIATKFKEKIKLNIGQRRPGDPEYLVANPSLFIKKTKFKYKHSNIDNIIETSKTWFKYRSENAN